MMNFNDNDNNNNRLINHSQSPIIQNCQGWYPCPSSQDESIQELQHKPKKKSRGNRKLQRYRRKLRKQGINPDTTCLTDTSIDIDSNNNNSKILNEPILSTVPFVNDTIVHQTKMTTITTKTDKTHTNIHKHRLVSSEQPRKNMRMKRNIKRLTHINEVNSLTTMQPLKNILINNDNSIDYTDVPDEIFLEMLSTAFNGNTDRLNCLFNEKEKIEFVRHYTTLIDRLSYVKLQELQWNYYHHIGITQHIWTKRISKQLAEKNSICYTYGKSKLLIQQRRKKIQKQLQQTQYTIYLFEQQILFKTALYSDCYSEIKSLSSILHTFVHEHQQKVRDEFEYKKQKLILDATDHHLVQAFFDLMPDKLQKATANQTMINEQVAILEKRLSSKQTPPPSTLLDHMIDDIDKVLSTPNDVIEQNVSTNFPNDQLEKMNQLKHDIIQQSIITATNMSKNYLDMSLNRNYEESQTTEIQNAVLKAMETRRLHMMKRAQYLLQYKLASYFK
ncbi:unnamed protein product [Adineta steineri]|uniref:Uncharacterized protein n=1 Tax=Adineta steineri TaxID=433720 RepID=A0A818TGM9_9BILA|nr:unnamed protein product [Adineta steineri]CAF3679553.1 unnamed protein product [Adineta steineri]